MSYDYLSFSSNPSWEFESESVLAYIYNMPFLKKI